MYRKGKKKKKNRIFHTFELCKIPHFFLPSLTSTFNSNPFLRTVQWKCSQIEKNAYYNYGKRHSRVPVKRHWQLDFCENIFCYYFQNHKTFTQVVKKCMVEADHPDFISIFFQSFCRATVCSYLGIVIFPALYHLLELPLYRRTSANIISCA